PMPMPLTAPKFEACGAVSEYLACAEGTLVCEDTFLLSFGKSKRMSAIMTTPAISPVNHRFNSVSFRIDFGLS
ncbi:MAG: hypothetical protein ACXACD_14885, partial [Candidatus Thorarchaeota archaeon]